MNKKIASVMLCVAVLLTLVACTNNKPEATSSSEDIQAETTQETKETFLIAENVLDEEGFFAEEEDQVNETLGNEAETNGEQETTEDEKTQTENNAASKETLPAEENNSVTETVAHITEYEKYHAMTGAEQKQFVDSFDSIEEFFEWYNAARDEYDALHPEIGAGDLEIDLSGGVDG